jgi:flavin-binding protein dodecin
VADSVYKVIELVGTSSESWEKEQRRDQAGLQVPADLRVADGLRSSNVALEDGKIKSYRSQGQGLVQVRETRAEAFGNRWRHTTMRALEHASLCCRAPGDCCGDAALSRKRKRRCLGVCRPTTQLDATTSIQTESETMPISQAQETTHVHPPRIMQPPPEKPRSAAYSFSNSVAIVCSR